MGLIASLLGLIFGQGRNAVAETVEVFRPNAEAEAVRDAARYAASLGQFASEFALPRRGIFDRFIDGLNRLPRPALALGTLGLFIAAMIDPIWFSQRMQGVALVPEPLWWLMGAIVSFYFGARQQTKYQEFTAGLAAAMVRAPDVAANIQRLDALGETSEVSRDLPVQRDGNAAIQDWTATHADE